jgi:hypothetical protein
VNCFRKVVGAALQSSYFIQEGKIGLLFIITQMQFGVVVYRADQFHTSVKCVFILISADGLEFEVTEVLLSYGLSSGV